MRLVVATPRNAAELSNTASRAFIATYSEFNTPEDMAQHLQSTLSKGNFLKRLENPDIQAYLAIDDRYHERRCVGYFQLRHGDWSCPARSNAGEVLTFYLEPDAIGKGLGAELMKHCKIAATARGYNFVWLGVWEKNTRAIGFYQRMGYTKVGVKSFQLGTDLQNDWVMELKLAD